MEQIKRRCSYICGKIEKSLTEKKLSMAALFVFALSLVPIIYLSFVNRASGDDYGYGTYTRAAWSATHSLWEVFKAAGRTAADYYGSWQGTWFSIILFSLQPEVFSDKAYVVVVFLMLFLWIGSTLLLFHQVLRKEWGMDRWSFVLLAITELFIGIQFVPTPRPAIFWFNGCAHYLVPFAMCQLLAWLLLRYRREYRKRQLLGLAVLALLLGGSNYQAALFALIVLFYAGLTEVFYRRKKKAFLLLLPMILETAGLVISMKAPGNKVRGGEDFGFSLSRAGSTVVNCFVQGFLDIRDYLVERPLVLAGLFVMFLFFMRAFSKKRMQKGQVHPLLKAAALFCLYSAMQAPELYAAVNVSGGVGNMNYMTFLLTGAGMLAILADALAGKMKRAEKIMLPGLVFCLVLLVLCRSNLKTSTTWVSMEYILSGQAADYKEQMELQTRLLTDEETKDVVVPFINDVQGPLMQMPVTGDPAGWTNTVTAGFYGKNSVVAIPREEWLERYGDE